MTRWMRTAVGAVAAAATALTLGAGTGAGAASAATSVGDAVVWPDTGTPVSLPMGTAIAGLPVTAESRDGYQRSSFKHWVDADRDGCSTRSEVLIDEGASPPSVGPRCALSGGIWLSYYDMKPVTDPRGLDIDHMVPLAEAWDSGASGWTSERRQDYANDLTEPRALVAVTAGSNRSKADQDPASWLPPAEAAHCQYLTDWVTVKTRWGLSVDTAERTALTRLAEACPKAAVTTVTG